MTNTNMLHGNLTIFHTNPADAFGNRAARRRGTGSCTGTAHGRPEGSRPAERAVAGGRLHTEGEASPSGRRVGWVDLGLPHGRWAVRVLYGGGRRAAMEIHEHGELCDVVVESTLGAGLLRGARRIVRQRRPAFAAGHDRPAPTTLAWGRLPESGTPPLVTFLNRGRNGHSCAGWVVPVAECFWIACVEGSFSTVRAETTDGAWAKIRASRTRAVIGRATDNVGGAS